MLATLLGVALTSYYLIQKDLVLHNIFTVNRYEYVRQTKGQANKKYVTLLSIYSKQSLNNGLHTNQYILLS